jgi:hypothetical protein
MHALILDGVLVPAQDGRMIFQRLPRLTTLDVEEVLATIEPLVGRRLEWADRNPVPECRVR